MYSAIGLAGAGLLSVVAWLRSGKPSGNTYADAYGMTPATHRNYAFTGAAFFVAFVALALLHQSAPATVLLAPLAVVALLYATSFLRGFSETEDV